MDNFHYHVCQMSSKYRVPKIFFKTVHLTEL